MPQPQIEHLYKNSLMDSGRWKFFKHRDSDIIISTPSKAGTTWIQRICSLLIFQSSVELDRPIAQISPWLDQLISPIEEIIDLYESQTHRRFIKSHTPLTALPYFPNVTYLVCGRDPRDIFISMENHYNNLDMAKFIELTFRNSDVVEAPPLRPDDMDVNERFELWLTKGSFPWESDGYPFWSTFHHLQSFWSHRELPNIHFIHYADLQADLASEMRRIASILQIEIDESQWPELVKGATFSEMKKRYYEFVPNVDQAFWRNASKFFNKGVSGQWREIFSVKSLELYEAAKLEKLEPSLAAWIDTGYRAAGQNHKS